MSFPKEKIEEIKSVEDRYDAIRDEIQAICKKIASLMDFAHVDSYLMEHYVYLELVTTKYTWDDGKCDIREDVRFPLDWLEKEPEEIARDLKEKIRLREEQKELAYRKRIEMQSSENFRKELHTLYLYLKKEFGNQ